MAELFLEQGHMARALAIYRRVVRERPDDAATKSRLAELEAAWASPRGEPMSFKEHMQRIVDDVPGAFAGVIMGFDGIPIDSYEKQPSAVDITTLLTEYSSAAQHVQRTAEALPQAGGIHEVAIAAENLTALLRPLTADYFLAVVLGPDGLPGKARFLMRLASPRLVEELS